MELVLDIKKDVKKIKIVADALSNEKRLLILKEIIKAAGTASHKEISEALGIKSPSVTFHLKYLIDAGLVVQHFGVGSKNTKNKKPNIKIKKIVVKL